MLSLSQIRKVPILRIFLIPIGIGIIYLLGVRVWELVRIFSGHPGLQLTQGQVLEGYQDRDPTIPAPIPKIIHQVFHNWTDFDNEHVPEDYAAQRQTCIDANPGWDNRVWLVILHVRHELF
jgi:hypothetical protein